MALSTSYYILDITDESEDRLPTREETAQKCIGVYWEVISKHKNRPRKQLNRAWHGNVSAIIL
jgi:hypothetical protein